MNSSSSGFSPFARGPSWHSGNVWKLEKLQIYDGVVFLLSLFPRFLDQLQLEFHSDPVWRFDIIDLSSPLWWFVFFSGLFSAHEHSWTPFPWHDRRHGDDSWKSHGDSILDLKRCVLVSQGENYMELFGLRYFEMQQWQPQNLQVRFCAKAQEWTSDKCRPRMGHPQVWWLGFNHGTFEAMDFPIGAFLKRVPSKWMVYRWFIMEISIKIDDFGVSLF